MGSEAGRHAIGTLGFILKILGFAGTAVTKFPKLGDLTQMYCLLGLELEVLAGPCSSRRFQGSVFQLLAAVVVTWFLAA